MTNESPMTNKIEYWDFSDSFGFCHWDFGFYNEPVTQ